MTQVSEHAQVNPGGVATAKEAALLPTALPRQLMQALLHLGDLQEHVYYSGWPAASSPTAGSKPGTLVHKTLTQVDV